MALSSVKKAFTAKPAYAGDPNNDFLAEACRKATAKNAYQPDDSLKNLIANKINETTPGAQVPIKVAYDIIRRRLQMENPHKQWLAVDLTRHLLSACKERLRPYRTELLYHTARVAIKPNKKGPITDQHNARKAATDFLHQCGDEGQNALRMARMQLGQFPTQSLPMAPMGSFNNDPYTSGYPGASYSTVPPGVNQKPADGRPQNNQPRIANVQQPTGDVMKDVQNLIDTAESHSNLLNELIMAGTAGNGKDTNAPLLSELKQEMLQVKAMFPRLLEQLSTLKTPSSEGLMAQALESHERIDNCLDMERQYAEGLQAEAEVAQDKADGHLRDDDDDEEDDADAEKDSDAANSGAKARTSSDQQAEKSDSGAAPSPPQPSGGATPAFDLLNFDSAPIPGPSVGTSAPAQPAVVNQPDDLFGLGALESSLPDTAQPAVNTRAIPPPSPLGHDDPFMSESGPTAPAAESSQTPSNNPFNTPTVQVAVPVNGAGVPPSPLPSPAPNNPFGGSAFGAQGVASPGSAQSPPAPSQPFPVQQLGPQGLPGQPVPDQQFMSSQNAPGQFGVAGPTGAYMTAPTGMPGAVGVFPQNQAQPGYQMYAPPPGWSSQGPPGAPGQGHPFRGSAFPPQGNVTPQGQRFPGVSNMPQSPFPMQPFAGASPAQFAGNPPAATAPIGPGVGGIPGFGGPTAPLANPFAPQNPGAPVMPSTGFGTAATGMPAPGFHHQPNPFAATATGQVPAWNPHAHKDAFGDLIIEHNKRTNPAPAMTAPMRAPGNANGLL